MYCKGDTLGTYLFIICLDYVLRTSIDEIKENGFKQTKEKNRRYSVKKITDTDYTDDIVWNEPLLALASKSMHTRRNICWQVHLPSKQCLINRDRHQHATSKGVNSYDGLSVIWKSDLTDKMKSSFFQAAVVSILLYGYITWTLTKRNEKNLDGSYTRILWAILNKSWRQHPTKQQLFCHLPPITKTIQVRRTRHSGHWWRSRDELKSDVVR